MDSIITPDFVKMLIALGFAVAYLVREMGKKEHLRNQSQAEQQRERQQMHQQMMAGLKSIDIRQEKLETWASNHERADRLRFRRVGRCMESILPPEQRHMAGRLT